MNVTVGCIKHAVGICQNGSQSRSGIDGCGSNESCEHVSPIHISGGSKYTVGYGNTQSLSWSGDAQCHSFAICKTFGAIISSGSCQLFYFASLSYLLCCHQVNYNIGRQANNLQKWVLYIDTFLISILDSYVPNCQVIEETHFHANLYKGLILMMSWRRISSCWQKTQSSECHEQMSAVTFILLNFLLTLAKSPTLLATLNTTDKWVLSYRFVKFADDLNQSLMIGTMCRTLQTVSGHLPRCVITTVVACYPVWLCMCSSCGPGFLRQQCSPLWNHLPCYKAALCTSGYSCLAKSTCLSAVIFPLTICGICTRQSSCWKL